jgi:hypothetical protein
MIAFEGAPNFGRTLDPATTLSLGTDFAGAAFDEVAPMFFGAACVFRSIAVPLDIFTCFPQAQHQHHFSFSSQLLYWLQSQVPSEARRAHQLALAVIKCIYLPPTYLYLIQDIEDRCLLLTSSTSFVDLTF